MEGVNFIFNNLSFWFYAVVAIALVFFGLWVKKRSVNQNSSESKNDYQEELKNSGNRIRVVFDHCHIKHREYEQEVILRKDTRYQKRIIVRYSECEVIFELKTDKKVIAYTSPTLYMELINLRYKLYEKKETIIYVSNKNNFEVTDEEGFTRVVSNDGEPYYYFDLEFLGDKVFSRPKY
ncbi:hypothetical protein [Maribacter sp. 2-571]|uniref:hypothetical protein n=1 Tax=Maribacter sp. 2-571 TaxID=3417569 RepID=UPI003D33C6FC